AKCDDLAVDDTNNAVEGFTVNQRGADIRQKKTGDQKVVAAKHSEIWNGCTVVKRTWWEGTPATRSKLNHNSTQSAPIGALWRRPAASVVVKEENLIVLIVGKTLPAA